MKVVLLSPDTGQQGGSLKNGPNVHALSGKAVRTHFELLFMKNSKSFGRVASAPALSLITLAVATQLQAQVLEINPVVISATRMAQPLSEVLASVSVITRQDIDKSQAASLADLLRGEAGFEFGRSGGPGSTTSFFLRGQESKNVVLMIDGVRSQTDGIGALTMTHVPLSQIERVEILRGNAGALYGEAAIGGVINVTTRAGAGEPKAYGTAMMGSRQTSELTAGYGGKVNDITFDVNAGASESVGFSAMNPAKNATVNSDRDGTRDQYVAANVSQKMDASLRIGLRANSKTSRADYDTDNSWSGLKTDTNQFQIKSDSLGVFANKRLSDQWTMDVDLAQTHFAYEAIKNGTVATNSRYEGHQDVLRLASTYALHDTTLLNVGIDRANEAFNQRTVYDMKRDTQAVFAGVTTQINRWNFQANVRRDELTVDRNSSATSLQKNYVNHNHLLGVGYQLSPEWRLTSTLSTGFRAPAANDLVGAYGNPNLQPETHRAEELGLVYNVSNALMRVVYFQTQTQNTIAYDSQYKPQNTGEMSNKGLELSTRSQIWSNQVKGALVLQDPWNVTGGFLPGRRAKQYGSLDVSRGWNAYDIGLKMNASSSRSDFSYAGSPMLAGYATLDLYVSRRLSESLILRAKLENALDKKYELAGAYNTPGRGLFITLQYQPK
jgi:vitamin B12 transporter